MQASDIVLVFTDEDGLKGLLKGKVKLGANASTRAGYRNNVTREQILLGKAVGTNANVGPFGAALRKVSRPQIHIRKTTQK